MRGQRLYHAEPPSVPESGTPMRYDEFCNLPEGAGMQLIDGILVREPSPAVSHQSLVGKLFVRLYTYAEQHQLGETYIAPLDVIIETATRTHSLQPDILFVSAARLSIVGKKGLLGAPDLVIEVLSPSTRRYDAGRKRDLYLSNGCHELWLVDRLNEQVEVCRPDQGSLLHDQAGVVASEVVAGFRIRVADLFAQVHR